MKKRVKSTGSFLKHCMTAALSASLIATSLPCGSLVEAGAGNVKADASEREVTVYQSDNGADGQKIKNVIYMIPDGGGYPSYDLTRTVKSKGGLNFDTITKQTSNTMYMEEYWCGSVTTRSNNNNVTDSAAAGTALATGKKTNNDYTGVDTEYRPIANILELAELEGKATGLISTSYQYDATPAAFSGHTKSRKDYSDLVSQMLYTDLEVILGGGGMTYSGYSQSSSNISKAQSLGYEIASGKSQLQSIASNATAGTKVMGTMNASDHHMPYDVMSRSEDGNKISANDCPSLAEMTEASLDILSKDPNGFCLMIEGSKVDYACHHARGMEITGEYIAFDEAFKVAVDYAKEHKDTVVLAVPDHNTGLTCDYNYDWNDIAEQIRNGSDATDKLPKAAMDGSSNERPHTGANVGLWMYVPEGYARMEGTTTEGDSNANRDQYVVDNTDVAPYLASLMSDRTLEEATGELYVDVTSQGSYNNGTFRFNDYDASATANTDLAVVKGENVDLGGALNIYVDNKMYVPMALMKQLGVDMEVVTEEDILGQGTKEDPYVIRNRAQFLKFTNNVLNGDTYEGKYIKQTANFDMTGVKDYEGMTNAVKFAGTYDGQGYTITADISAAKEKGVALFPDVTGTVLNLGVQGAVNNSNTNGASAGLAVKVSGTVVNCWSTVDISGKKDGAGIAAEVSGNVYNCFYRGKNTATNNCGVAKAAGGKVENCLYQMEDGSTQVSGNDAGGSQSTDFSAATLNAKQEPSISALGMESVDQLCKFADVEGHEFVYAGSIAKFTKLKYSYTGKDGQSCTEDVPNFQMDETGYDVVIGDRMNGNYPIILDGEPLMNGSTEDCVYTITKGERQTDEKGFASIEVVLTTSAKTDYYETTATAKYNCNFTGAAPVPETPSPAPTSTPTQVPATAVPTATPVVRDPIHYATAKPTVTPTVAPTATVTPTVAPTATATVTPVPTTAATVTPTAIVATATPEPKVDVNSCNVILEQTNYVYRRKRIKPEIMVLGTNGTLEEGKDYTVTYSNNLNAGKGKIIITGMGNYTGSRMDRFNITKKSIVSLSSRKNAKKCTVTFKFGSYQLKKAKDYKLTVKKLGKKKVIVYVTGKGNYTGKKKFTFKK